VNQVEIRAQVGGTLKQIAFKDGSIVRKGDLLFVIDPVPYQIRMAQAQAQLAAANARLELANRELTRAEALKLGDAGTGENVDQRAAEQKAAQAAVAAALAQINDAKFDLNHCRITAPFTGKIGAHQVSVGNLVAGSRAATTPTTLLATLVSIDPIWITFDMSEGDYLAFRHANSDQHVADKIEVQLADETRWAHPGTLDFIDNALDRSSGTLHARATIPNSDLALTPGEFGRVRLAVGVPKPALLVPDAAVQPDQDSHVVLTVGPGNKVVPKEVQVGAVRGGLRVIRSGLAPSDRVIVDGAALVMPGAQVTPHNSAIQFAPGQDEG
jgi:RND family efflux transporter MFP subunit